MLDIAVEDASIRDLDELHRIEKECFRQEAFTRQQIAFLLEDYNTVSLAAKQKGAITGFIMGNIHMNRRSSVGHILTVDVASKYRRRGIGLQLLAAIERLFKEKGVRRCSLEVREDNTAALRLYRKAGYTQVGILKNYYKNCSGLLLTKDL